MAPVERNVVYIYIHTHTHIHSYIHTYLFKIMQRKLKFREFYLTFTRREKRQNLLNFAVEHFIPARGTPVLILRVFWKTVLRQKCNISGTDLQKFIQNESQLNYWAWRHQYWNTPPLFIKLFRKRGAIESVSIFKTVSVCGIEISSVLTIACKLQPPFVSKPFSSTIKNYLCSYYVTFCSYICKYRRRSATQDTKQLPLFASVSVAK